MAYKSMNKNLIYPQSSVNTPALHTHSITRTLPMSRGLSMYNADFLGSKSCIIHQ